MKMYEFDEKKFNHNDIHSNPCLFTSDEIKHTIRELYPNMNESDVNYHSEHIEDNDWLKVANNKDELIQVIKEQVEEE